MTMIQRLSISVILFVIIKTVMNVKNKPNIVFILVDDLGFGDVGWNNKKMKDVTPKISRLASKGITLSDYYVQPVCTPSRAALMTGSNNILNRIEI